MGWRWICRQVRMLSRWKPQQLNTCEGFPKFVRTIPPWKRPNKTIWDTLKFTGNRVPPHCFLYHFHHSCVPKNKNTPGGSCWIYGKTQSANWLGRIIWAIPWDMFFTIVSCKQTTSTLQLLSKFLILWHLSLSFKPPNIPQKDFFFW